MPVDPLAASGAPPEAVAVETPDRSWSYAELDREVDRRAVALDVRPGRLVPLPVRPDLEGLVDLLAHWRVGATPAPLNPVLTATERSTADAALAGVASSAQVVLWTSGTAGRARGVEIPWEAFEASTRGAVDRLELRGSDVWLASLSPAHVGGLTLLVRSLLVGCRLVLAGPFDAASVDRLLDHGTPSGGRPTHMSLVPTQLARLLDARGGRPPGPGFRCVLVGGAHAPPDLLRRALDAGWPVALTYGMTETTSQAATAPPALVSRKPGTVGRPLDGVELRLAPDGEILVRGATLASRYVGGGEPRPCATDGWVHTGDLGRLDEEGDLWVTGRRSDRIVTGGVTVDAGEVEETLRRHPAVADACVVGLPDPEWGERVAACLVPASGAVDPAEIDAWVRERLGGLKRPRAWLVKDALPLNANGKVDRGAVRAAFEAR